MEITSSEFYGRKRNKYLQKFGDIITYLKCKYYYFCLAQEQKYVVAYIDAYIHTYIYSYIIKGPYGV